MNQLDCPLVKIFVNKVSQFLVVRIVNYREMSLQPLVTYVCEGKMCRRESQQHHTPVRLPQLASLLRAVLLFCSNEWMFCIETKMLKRKVLIGYHVFIISPPTCVWWQSANVFFLSTVIIIFPNVDFVTTTSLDWILHLVFMIAEKQKHFLY